MKSHIILKCADTGGGGERVGGCWGERVREKDRQVIQHKEPTGIWAFPLQ